MSVECEKKKRNVINFYTKFDIIKRFYNGKIKRSISRALRLNESMVPLILSRSNECIEEG
jgi:hypothetical protein